MIVAINAALLDLCEDGYQHGKLVEEIMDENQLSKIIVDAAIEVHRSLGRPGLLESVYEEALAWELRRTGVSIERQRIVPIRYKGQCLATALTSRRSGGRWARYCGM